MSLYDDLPKKLQAHIDTPAKFNLLQKLRFANRTSIETTFPNEFKEAQSLTRQYLCIKYHGMGHYQIAMLDPTRSERKFYLLIVGGSNGWQRGDNINQKLHEDNFCTLTELLLYAYGTDEAPIYVDLADLKKTVDITAFADFISNE